MQLNLINKNSINKLLFKATSKKLSNHSLLVTVFNNHNKRRTFKMPSYFEETKELLEKAEGTNDIVIVTDIKDLPPPKVQKTEEEWKTLLTDKQYSILRDRGTEASFCSGYKVFKEQIKQTKQEEGVFECSACGNPLFQGNTSFESGSGWPSFWKPAQKDSIGYIVDNSHGMERIEVVCLSCHSHLGHVFCDGPKQTTGLRYCINAACLNLRK